MATAFPESATPQRPMPDTNRYANGKPQGWNSTLFQYKDQETVCSTLTHLSREYPDFQALSVESLVRTVADIESKRLDTFNTRMRLKCTGIVKDLLQMPWFYDVVYDFGALTDPELICSSSLPQHVVYEIQFKYFTQAFAADFSLDGSLMNMYSMSVEIIHTEQTAALLRQLRLRVQHHFQAQPMAPRPLEAPRGALLRNGRDIQASPKEVFSNRRPMSRATLLRKQKKLNSILRAKHNLARKMGQLSIAAPLQQASRAATRGTDG